MPVTLATSQQSRRWGTRQSEEMECEELNRREESLLARHLETRQILANLGSIQAAREKANYSSSDDLGYWAVWKLARLEKKPRESRKGATQLLTSCLIGTKPGKKIKAHLRAHFLLIAVTEWTFLWNIFVPSERHHSSGKKSASSIEGTFCLF